MPLIDIVRKGGTCVFGYPVRRRQRRYRIITSLNSSIIKLIYSLPQMPRQHLRTQTNAKQRLPFTQRLIQPIDFFTNIRIAIICAHRTTENYRTIVLPHILREKISKSWPADIKLESQLTQQQTNSARRGVLLMQDNQNFSCLIHGAILYLNRRGEWRIANP
ncbi:hypothetical protein MY55_05010 [Chromobacterium subtsugae]|nr:hypothetical protein MY55_05010 [Chromobacterium subtsugae]